MDVPSHVRRVRAIFSDIDGTIVHYEAVLRKQGYTLDVADLAAVPDGGTCTFTHTATGAVIPVRRVPSLTLGGGFISLRTLELVERLRREHCVLYCLLTGARTSTYRLRQDSGTVPLCDFGVCEGGGKLWRLGADGSYTLDDEWLRAFAQVTGPSNQSETIADPLHRVGPLWDCYRELHARGYGLDAKSFDTAFLLDLRKGRDGFEAAADEEQLVKDLFHSTLTPKYGVTIVTNLGKGHVHPVGCNKRTVVERILAATCITPDESMAMFDDENDLEFASLCAFGALPGVAHDAVHAALKDSDWMRNEYDGFLATEAFLEAVLRHCAQHIGE